MKIRACIILQSHKVSDNIRPPTEHFSPISHLACCLGYTMPEILHEGRKYEAIAAGNHQLGELNGAKDVDVYGVEREKSPFLITALN